MIKTAYLLTQGHSGSSRITVVIVLSLIFLMLLSISGCSGRWHPNRTPVPNLTPMPFPEMVDGCTIHADTNWPRPPKTVTVCPGTDFSLVDLGNTRAGRDYIRKGANLGGANFEASTFIDAKMGGIHLEGANLSNSNLTGADLTSAYLYQADFSGTTLTHASLELADVDEVNFLMNLF